jgi:hypothetical protein
MSKLKAATRNALPASDFGMPGQRKYPMPDASHAANAKARAQQQYNRGALSAGQLHTIDDKANRVLSSRGFKPRT